MHWYAMLPRCRSASHFEQAKAVKQRVPLLGIHFTLTSTIIEIRGTSTGTRSGRWREARWARRYQTHPERYAIFSRTIFPLSFKTGNSRRKQEFELCPRTLATVIFGP